MKKAFMMTGLILAILGSGLFFLLKKNTAPPPEALREKLNIDIPLSTFNIPIILDTAILADYLNGKITGQFLETKLFLQEKKKKKSP